MNTAEKEDSVTLGLLEVIEKNDNVTQRHMASHLGVALGLANSYLKRCARKGFIKIKQAPPNRYLYYLTPKGFAEKSRLTALFLRASLDFYRKASDDYFKLIQQCENSVYKKVILCGLSELAEIASLRIQESELEIIAVFDPWKMKEKFLDIAVYSKIESLPVPDVFILTEMNRPLEILNKADRFCDDRVVMLIPEFLNFIQE